MKGDRYGRWVKIGQRPGMVSDWTEDEKGRVLVQLGADGPFEWWPPDDVDLITEKEWYDLMGQK